MQEFSVSQTKAILALSLYVLAYGIGVGFLQRTMDRNTADLPRLPAHDFQSAFGDSVIRATQCLHGHILHLHDPPDSNRCD